MNNDVPQQQENGERPGWFLSWLKEVFLPQQRDPVEEQLEKFSDALESIPILDDSVRQTLATTLNHEARVGGARQQDRLKIKEILKTQAIPAVEPGVGMPWSKISDAEAKIISRALENLKIQDFSVKSLKHWISFYQDVFDKGFVHSRVGRLAIIYNSCSICLKNRLTGLGVGEDANEDSYTFLNLLQLITTIVHSPDAHDLAVMLLHDGIKQSASESVQSFLEKFKLVLSFSCPSSVLVNMMYCSVKYCCSNFLKFDRIIFQWSRCCCLIIIGIEEKNTSPGYNSPKYDAKSVVSSCVPFVSHVR